MSKSIFICQSCGAVYKKWSGQCKECGEGNTITEEVEEGGFISPNTNITQTIIDANDIKFENLDNLNLLYLEYILKRD